jgi:hypothetical protein
VNLLLNFFLQLDIVLQLFLNSPKPTLRFAAVRTLTKLASLQPAMVAPCNLDIENLLNDPNRSIATFAITTLLKVYSWYDKRMTYGHAFRLVTRRPSIV